MNKSKILKTGAGIAISTTMLLSFATLAFAQDSGSSTSNESGVKTSVQKKQKNNAKGVAKEKINQSKEVVKANTEIEKRIKDLNDMGTKISDMKNLNDSDKSALSGTINSEIENLNNLKAKIGSDTDPAALKTDVKAITANTRVYALEIPKIKLTKTVDTTNTAIKIFNAMVPKLQARIGEAQTAGKDVTSLNLAFADFNTKVADAKSLADSITSGIATLSPDNGNKAIMDSNKLALKAAQDNVKKIEADLKAAREDVKAIMKKIKGVGASANSETPVSSSTTTDTVTPSATTSNSSN